MSEVSFVDSSVFLHAYLRPRREMRPDEVRVKEAAKEVLLGIEAGERVVTTVVHLSEVANVVESRVGLRESLGLVAWLLSADNVEVLPVEGGDYRKALSAAERFGVGLKDALAYVKMRDRGVGRAYSFDRHFRRFPGIEVAP